MGRPFFEGHRLHQGYQGRRVIQERNGEEEFSTVTTQQAHRNSVQCETPHNARLVGATLWTLLKNLIEI